ncbi:MAG: hypothetical protein WCI71_11895 [Bacteroidota bacterium]
MKSLVSETTLERIKLYYLSDNTQLSEHDEQVRQRWEAAYSMLINQNGIEREVVKMLMKLHNLSEMQAYRDVYNCTRCFGPVRGMDRQALRHMVTQWAIESYRKALVKNDFKAMDKALERIIKANNLDKEDMELPDPSKIQPPVQLLSINYNFLNTEYFKLIDPKAQEALLKLNEKVIALIMASPIADYKDLLLADDTTSEDVTD